MTASFRAYIDESGDEGFKFRKLPSDVGSSDWFVISAFVTRKQFDLETVKLVDTVRSEFSLPARKHIHWKDLKHQQRVRYAQLMTQVRSRAISVCVHKPSLLEPEKFRQRYRLYFYAVRYLLERLTWLVRDNHNPQKYGGDGTVEIQFSNRQGMSYDELKAYLRHLEEQKRNGHDVRIEFELSPIDEISTQTPGRSMGLQLADAVAGATFNALERDAYGNTEPRYIETLTPILYQNEGSVLGYGLKIVPRETATALANERCLEWLWKLK